MLNTDLPVHPGPPPPPTASIDGTHQYHAFISYSHKDRAWVDTYLLPVLEQAGLRVVIDYRDFDIGSLARDNMERFVDASQHVVLVVSPNWIESEWSGFEFSFAQSIDPDGRRRKLLPILIAPTELPRRLSITTCANFVDPDGYEREFARVIRALSPSDRPVPAMPTPIATPKAPVPVSSAPVVAGLGALSKLTRDDRIKEMALRFSAVFETARKQIVEVTGYKGLHDRLHELHQKVEDPMERVAADFPDDDEAKAELDEYRIIFEDVTQQLRQIARQFSEAEAKWIEVLDAALNDLRRALAQDDPALLKDVIRRVNRQLTLRLPQINNRLTAAAGALRLPDLVKALSDLRDYAATVESESPRLQQFRSGVEALDRMEKNLSSLLHRHDMWQEFDAQLRAMDKNLEDLGAWWPDVHELVGRIAESYGGVPWMPSFLAECDGLQSAINAGETAKVSRGFRLLRRQVGIRFYNTDADLKNQCDELFSVGEPLSSVLRVTA